MKNIAVILARSGSKRIADKNQILFENESLLNRQYRLASEASSIDGIIVFTDSIAYLSKVKKCSKYIDVGIRPESLSGDNATDLQCFDFLLSKVGFLYTSLELLVHLRPTYPALTVSNIDQSIHIMQNSSFDSLKSVEKTNILVQKSFTLDVMDRLVPLAGDFDSSSLPSQECHYLYVQTAAVDIYRPASIMNGSLWGKAIYPFECGELRGDINDFGDISQAYGATDLARSVEIINNNSKLNKQSLDGIKIVSDLDGVLFSRVNNGDYTCSTVIEPVAQFYRKLLSNGAELCFYTARGSKSGIDWMSLTRQQLDDLGFEDCDLHVGKPDGDFYIDDKFLSIGSLLNLSCRT